MEHTPVAARTRHTSPPDPGPRPGGPRSSAVGPEHAPAPRVREAASPTGRAGRHDASAEPGGTGGGAPETARAFEAGHRNEVVLVGRITAEPAVRELPSGDRLVTWRICVARPSETRFRGRRVDSITCVSFDPGVHDAVRGWRSGDLVRTSGALRRRTWRGHEGVRSVCEVETRSAVLVRARGPRRSGEAW